MQRLRNHSATLRERVAQAYHDYGRLCSAHPVACLSMSLVTMMVLSYPTFTRFRLISPSPISIYWDDKVYANSGERSPEWLRGEPGALLQQIIIRGTVDPWVSHNMTPEQAVRGPLSRAFLARNIVLSTEDVDALCLQVNREDVGSSYPLPHRGCLLLDPTAFWQNSLDNFVRDSDVLTTIFSRECSAAICSRDVFLGMPAVFTGIKPTYRSNKKRSIDFSLTLFFAQYDPDTRRNLLGSLSQGGFDPLPLSAEEENQFIHVFYRHQKAFASYLPLLSSYAIFTFYLYYSARKFEMVSSRWSLAFAAAFAVGATLFMTTGVCAHLELSPTLWGAEIFPYIALILGLENTLCITRAVVNTPPTLDVSSRIAHGLAQEGYSLCKYFVMELSFLAIGYATRIAEIQEFCMFASIGLVIDFYMQMFFYAPCLTFDLQRLSSEEKAKFALRLFNTDIPRLSDFVPVRCPMRKLWPSFFELKRRKKRTLSESQLDERDIQEDTDKKGFRCRSNSVSNTDWTYDGARPYRNPLSSNRLRILYFVTRTRIFQRTIMVIFAVWTIWLAFVVHKHGNFPFNTSSLQRGPQAFFDSEPSFESAPPQWKLWSERTFKWWPALFAEFNLTLPGSYITFLPPIILKTSINASDPLLYPKASTDESHSKQMPTKLESDSRTALKSRISWLEAQLRFYLAVVWLLLLTCVIGFILYVCFWGRWRTDRIRKKEVALASPKSLSPRGSIMELSGASKSMVESLPIVFSGHRFPIESCALCNQSRLITCCQEGKVCLWNVESGERILKLRRQRGVDETSADSHPVIWCITAKQYIAVCGCADGSLEIACLERNKLIGVYAQSRIGIVHVLYVGSRVVVARLDGSIEFLELLLTTERPIRVTSVVFLNIIRAHQKPISYLGASSLTAVSASYDHTLKVFDLRTCQLQSMLHAHSGPVTAVCIDHATNTLFSGCEQGIICWWNLTSGELLRSLDVKCTGRIQLACTTDYLLGYSSEDDFILWSKTDGSLISRIAQHHAKKDAVLIARGLVALGDELAVTASEFTLTFWDLEHKAIIRQIDLGSIIDRLYALDDHSVLCQCSNTMYRITSPVIRIA